MPVTRNTQSELKLKAISKTDLQVFASVLQDAILRVGDIHFDSRKRAFHLKVSRFSHEQDQPTRCLCGIRFAHVLKARIRDIDRTEPESLLVLLTLNYVAEESNQPAYIRLIFAGGGEIRLCVEYIEAVLLDVSTARPTQSIPQHPSEEP